MLLQMQQFYITKMMMLIFSIIVICLYLYSVCLVYRGLKNTFQWLLPNLAYAIRKILLRNFNYVQCLNLAQWKRHGL